MDTAPSIALTKKIKKEKLSRWLFIVGRETCFFQHFELAGRNTKALLLTIDDDRHGVKIVLEGAARLVFRVRNCIADVGHLWIFERV